jgi:diguanylate cyclase (GGDEF)-like protein/PAS domain S-box-containing protein
MYNSHPKKINTITLLLWGFVLFIILLFGYLTQLSKYIDFHADYYDKINELKIKDKEIDNFLLQKTIFINYDKINKSVLDFDKKIKYLQSQKTFSKYSDKYSSLLQEIEKHYQDKLSSVEYYKSENSQFLYSMHYLYDLNSAIFKSKTIDIAEKDIVKNTLLLLSKQYLNATIDNSTILKNINYLNRSSEDTLVKMFIKHVRLNTNRIKGFQKIKSLQNVSALEKALNNLLKLLEDDYKEHILVEKIIVIILFILAIIIMLILIYMNKRATYLRDKLSGFKIAVENSYSSIIITDADRNITYVNDGAVESTGYTKEELLGKNPRVLKSGLNDDRFYQELHSALNDGRKWEGEFINKKKDGSLFYEKASIMPIYIDGELVNYLAIKLNITDYVKEKHKVEFMAYHDSLTSLPNKTSIEEYLKNRLSAATRSKSKIAILFLDLDRFKTINETLGHDVGDELLIECAKRMKNTLRKSDMLARVGGDEFVIVIESPNSEYSAAHVCEKILQLFSTPIQTKEHSLNITLSIGVSIYPDDDTNYKQLFKYADIAMYEAKDAGKNTYRYYQKELSIEAHRRLDMEQNLKLALENSEIYIMYQPKYSIMDKRIVGFEALVRWESPTLGNISPDKFIPIAEDTGFIIEIGLFIFKQACRDFLEFRNYSQNTQTISINISAVQLYQDAFIDSIMKIVQDIGIDTRSIVLEITETHIMKNVNQSTIILKELKELGFSISIDDFGTGHSSLSYLKLFPIDELKIDKSFVDDLPYDRNDVAISKSIITLSKTMGYINVAEGIENEAQEEFLKENNCSIGQGFYFCEPKIKDDLINFIKERDEKK